MVSQPRHKANIDGSNLDPGLPKYPVAVHPMQLDGKLPDGDPRMAQLATGWVCQEFSQWDLAATLTFGQPWCQWMDGRRRRENFLAGQLIGVDIDEMPMDYPTVDDMLAHPVVSQYALMLYHTPSSTPENPRVRIVFALDVRLEDAGKYEAAVATLLSLFPYADQSAKDAARFFYAAKPGTEPIVLGNQLPRQVLADQYKRLQRQREREARVRRSKYRGAGRSSTPLLADGFRAKVQEIAGRLRTMSQGSRNNELNSAAHWVAGVDIDEATKQDALETLREAALASGLSERETDRTMRSATRG